MKPVVVALFFAAALAGATEPWQDSSLPVDVRVRDLVGRMTLPEKASQLEANPMAIPRLGIPAYSHRNECLHGVGDAGIATVFPQAIGMAATWDTALIQQEADAIATEGRAKHNAYVAAHDGASGEHDGVNFYSPNINIFRDPRWGRGQETYGEDPFLTSRMGVAFIRGLQGDDPIYLKAAACAKHFAVHSGPEVVRHVIDARPSERDLYETYLPAFEAAVREGHVATAMGAYSSLYGIPCCADSFLLTDLLRRRWGFDGLVFSDGGAIGDIWATHRYVPSPEAAAADAVKAGCDVSSGGMQPLRNPKAPGSANNGIKGGSAFSVLPQAVAHGLVTEAEVNTALTRELTLRFRLGLFDPPANVPWSKIGPEENDSPAHRELALRVAQASMVLLTNHGVLPLDRAGMKRIAVIGPNARAALMLSGNYHGTASHVVTILQGIQAAAGPDASVTFSPGCPLALRNDGSNRPSAAMTAEAVAAANAADVVIYVGGLDATLEQEETGPGRVPFQGFNRGDRTQIELPGPQHELIQALCATGKPVVIVNCSGSAVAMPWEAEHAAAILQAWYPGEEGGTAVAQALFGDVVPAGRLPVTIYASTGDLPPFDDYSMNGRTYRYFGGHPLFAFGHGLSYTRFDYADAGVAEPSVAADGSLKLTFALQNAGRRAGDEVAQVYFRRLAADDSQPRQALCAFTRVHLAAGDGTQVTLAIPAERLRRWNVSRHAYEVAPGDYELMIGAASDDIRCRVKFAVR